MAGCRWLISNNVSAIVFASWALRSRAPSSALVADAETHFKIVHNVIFAPLRQMGSSSLGAEPRKK